MFYWLSDTLLNIAYKFVNSVDTDQTAPKEQSDLGHHCLLRSALIPVLRAFTVNSGKTH